MNKKILLFFFFGWLIFPNLNGQENEEIFSFLPSPIILKDSQRATPNKKKAIKNGSFLRFQNQFSIMLAVVIPDGIISLDQSKKDAYFSPIKTPAQWQSVAVPSPDRSPRIYNYHEIGIFCKLDVKLDKVSKMPVRFRLGTQEAVDRKEGKY